MIPINYVFVAGTVIDPDQVNDNFFQLSSRALAAGGDAVTGPITFTPDNTHNIGATGARPRDLLLGRNATVGGTLTVTGATSLGVTNITGAVIAFTTLQVVGDANLSGATVIGGNINAGNGIFGGSLQVALNTTLFAQLQVQGVTTLNNALIMNGVATFVSDAVMNQALTVHGVTTLFGAVVIVGATSINNVLVLGSTLTIGGLAYTWPTSQVAGRFLQTNGAGVLSWAVPAAATPAAHATSHNTGGSDPLTALDGGIVTSGTVADARLTSNVLKVSGGFPGGTTNYLRADGTFAAPPSAGTTGYWTPVDGTSTFAFVFANGFYARSGPIVYATCYVQYPASGGATVAKISGLPLAPFDPGYTGYGVTVAYTNCSLQFSARVDSTGSIVFDRIATAPIGGAVTNNDLSNSTIRLAITYVTAA